MSATDPERGPFKRTALYPLHLELGARMVEFAGFELPVQYPRGIRHEHSATRNAATLFDISHMGQIRVEGDDAPALLETLVPSDIRGLKPWRQRYTVFTNDTGGVVDDLMVTCVPGGLFLVVNGACRDKDMAYLQTHLGPECRPEMLSGHSLLALQGPASEAALASLAPGVAKLAFLQAGEFELGGARCLVHRCGYTGEDGFEISVTDDHAEALARCLLACPGVEPAGLGARDSLRLEAGLCLYGHDLDTTTTPVEAGISWVIDRRYHSSEGEKALFPGAHIILEQLNSGPPRKRVGLLPQGRAPVRADAELTDALGAEAGRVTSGGFGCTLDRPVAMGYVAPQFAESGTELQVQIRNRSENIQVAPLPFITLHYRH